VNDRTADFEQHRGRLFGIAYRMLGSVADAEDVMQDAWLKWSQVDVPVEKPGAYLARTVTNLSLNRLTSATAQRERYVGPWLPEPLIGDSSPDVVNDVADAAEQAESVSLAMLVVLESLSPAERAVFILREVFGYPHREIADALGRTEAAVRQLARRAKSQVADRRPRFPTSAAEQRRVTEEFLTACMGGDIGRMMELLAPDVMVWTDGGGQISGAASHPVRGSEHAAHGALRAFRGLTDATTSFTLVNGRPGVVITEGGVVDRVACMEVVDGLITEVRVICNPEKLRHVTAP
jgi:RNA polymerase sigma-70 factor, ECF subfamily